MNKAFFLSFGIAVAVAATSSAQSAETELLGKAIEYFQGGKYGEALSIFGKLESGHNLNARFKAYIGVCYYYEWQYDKAADRLSFAIPQLGGFAPHELSFYCFACAESYFNLGEYDKALPYYTQQLTLCYDNEKPDVYYRIGFIHMFRQEWTDALDNFQSSLVYYERFRNDQKARMTQIRNMINGCAEKIDSLNESMGKARKEE